MCLRYCFLGLVSVCVCFACVYCVRVLFYCSLFSVRVCGIAVFVVCFCFDCVVFHSFSVFIVLHFCLGGVCAIALFVYFVMPLLCLCVLYSFPILLSCPSFCLCVLLLFVWLFFELFLRCCVCVAFVFFLSSCIFVIVRL